MLGENYRGVLTSDRWTAYSWIKRRQLCWAHLRRDFQAMIDRCNSGSDIGTSLLSLSDQMFHWWHRVRDGTLARSSFQKYIGPLRTPCVSSWNAVQSNLPPVMIPVFMLRFPGSQPWFHAGA